MYGGTYTVPTPETFWRMLKWRCVVVGVPPNSLAT
jgi:hypothetical protein